MRSAATLAAIASLAASGCIYMDPINQRPSLDIRQTSSEEVLRGGDVELEAIVSDPEQQDVELRWDVRVCTDPDAPGGCDEVPIFDGGSPTASFRVPPFRAAIGGDAVAPVEWLRVVLAARDDRGAAAHPDQVLVLPVKNHPPELALRVVRNTAVVAMPIEVFAKYSDPDDTRENVSVTWSLFSPRGAPPPLDEFDVPDDPSEPESAQVGVRFTPAVTDTWTVRAAVEDKSGARIERSVDIHVAEDAPPCLALWQPLASTTPVPLLEPAQFAVSHVTDDLDAFPRMAGASIFGETTFRWSLRAGAEPRRPLGNATERIALDPSVYAPGTILELRVEIFDRKETPIPCADDAATCSVSAQPGCVQRQTWHLEAR